MLTFWQAFRVKKPVLKVRKYKHSATHPWVLDLRAFGKATRQFEQNARGS